MWLLAQGTRWLQQEQLNKIVSLQNLCLIFKIYNEVHPCKNQDTTDQDSKGKNLYIEYTKLISTFGKLKDLIYQTIHANSHNPKKQKTLDIQAMLDTGRLYTFLIYKISEWFWHFKEQIFHLLNDLDKLPMQTMNTKADGNKGDTRSINIPARNAYDFIVVLQEWQQKHKVMSFNLLENVPKINKSIKITKNNQWPDTYTPSNLHPNLYDILSFLECPNIFCTTQLLLKLLIFNNSNSLNCSNKHWCDIFSTE